MSNVQTDTVRKRKVADSDAEKSRTFEEVPVKSLPKDLSFEYNCRFPSPRSKAYKAMRFMLEDRPSEFCGENSGMVIANRKYVLDGGHTYLAIQDARKAGVNLDNVMVKVTWEDGLTTEEMVRRSISLNNKVTPPLAGERDLAGDWDIIKMNLDDKYKRMFEFKTNTNPEAEYDVAFLVALLHGWWPGKDRNGRVDRVYSGKGMLLKLFAKDKYLPVIPKINQMVEIWSLIASSIASLPPKELDKLSGVRYPGRMKLPNGTTLNVKVPEPYIWLMYTAVGRLLDANAEWTKDPEGIFKKSFKSMWKSLLSDYRENGQNPSQLGKSRSAYDRQAIALLT